MFLKYKVDIPVVPGKLVRKNRGGHTYIEYRNIGFILDRGYFSKKNLAYMDQNGYSFLIMVKGMKDFIRGIIEENQGGFENSRGKYVDRYDVYGTTVKRFYARETRKKGTFIFITVTEKLTVKSRRSSRGYAV